MILIDTSIWIEYLRKSGDLHVKRRVNTVVLAGEAAYTCPVYFELLAGAREEELANMKETLDVCHRLRFEASHWDAAARLYRRLRAQGVTVPAEDAYIAAAASERKIPLLCRDKHFDVIQEKGGLPLKVEQLLS